ncbi:MAG: PilN domain-containing protein [Gammaproteobacteria bacterium]
MAHINLLPWRAELRKQQRKAFLSILGMAALLAMGAVALTQWYYNQRIEYQNSRNTRLDSEIATLNKKIEEIKTLEKERDRLVKRIEAIQNLETNRPLVVHLFDEFVDTLPEGMFLNGIDQTGNNITVTGTAQSQTRVSSYMRNIEASKWVTNPKLDVVQTTSKEGERLSDFTLKVDQMIPKASEDDASSDQGSAGGKP